MTNEAVLMREVALPVSFTCSDSTGIEKGALLALTDPNTVATAAGVGLDRVAGIAAQEKIALNGQTKIAVYTQGDFKIIGSGSINAGDPVSIWGRDGNMVFSVAATANLSGNCVLGISKENSTAGQSLRVELKPQALKSA